MADIFRATGILIRTLSYYLFAFVWWTVDLTMSPKLAWKFWALWPSYLPVARKQQVSNNAPAPTALLYFCFLCLGLNLMHGKPVFYLRATPPASKAFKIRSC